MSETVKLEMELTTEEFAFLVRKLGEFSRGAASVGAEERAMGPILRKKLMAAGIQADAAVKP